MKKYVKYPLVTISALSVLVIVLFLGLKIYWWANSGDEPEPDDSDILPVIDDNDKNIPQEESVFYWYEKAKESMWLPKEKTDLFTKMANKEEWDDNFAKELIEKNQTALKNFKKITQSTVMVDPKIQNLKKEEFNFNTELSSFNDLRTLAKIDIIKADKLMLEKKEKEGIDTIIAVMTVGQMAENSKRARLMVYLVGMSLKRMALESLNKNISEMKLIPSELIEYANKFEIFKENEKGLSNTFKMEYLSDANSLKTNKENNELKEEIVYGAHNKDTEKIPYSVLGIIKKDKFFYKPNETKRLLGYWAKTYTENSLNNCHEIEEPKRVFQGNPLFTPNYIGKRLVSTITVSLHSVLYRKCTEDANIIETQLFLALKAYEQDNKGKKAATINDLVPKYLSEVPIDPFTGNPVEYSPETGVKINKERVN